MSDEDGLDIDIDEDESEDSTKNNAGKNPDAEASFTTEIVTNYGKEYAKLENIYTKKEIKSFNNLLDLKKLSKLFNEIEVRENKTRINWQYLYRNVFKMIINPINFNKVNISQYITLHEISYRLRYCVHCCHKTKNTNLKILKERQNLIPKIIDILTYGSSNLFKKYDNVNTTKKMSNKLNKKNNKNCNEDSLNNSNNFKIFKRSKSEVNNLSIESLMNNSTNKVKFIDNQSNAVLNEKKKYVRKNSGKKLTVKVSHLKFDIKKYGMKKKSNKKFNVSNKIEENNREYAEDIIKNIPKMTDDDLFDTKIKKNQKDKMKIAFDEAMNEFKIKNINLEIKDKNFCQMAEFFPLKDTYDKETNLEKRGELILDYKNMTDELLDLLNI